MPATGEKPGPRLRLGAGWGEGGLVFPEEPALWGLPSLPRAPFLGGSWGACCSKEPVVDRPGEPGRTEATAGRGVEGRAVGGDPGRGGGEMTAGS